jgi:O-antigen ligase
MALVWTESKGPLLAFIVSLLIFGVPAAKQRPRAIATICIVAIVFGYLLYPYVSSWLVGTRLDAVVRIFEWSFNDNDQGSVGDRLGLYRYAMSLIADNPVFGIGIGNFRFGQYVYPHNIHLEVFVELGVVVGMAHVIFVSVSFFRSSLLYRSVIVLFALCGCFSGDMSYLRFLYCFCLVGIYLGRVVNGRDVSAFADE